MKLDNILVIAESRFDEPPVALEKAVALSKQKGVALHLLCVVYSEHHEEASLIEGEKRESLKASLLNKAENEIKNLLESKFPEVSRLSFEVRWNDNLYHAIAELCEERPFDLVIKTGHRTESILHTPTDFQLLHTPKIPVMILRRHGWRPSPVVMASIKYLPHKKSHMALNKKILMTAQVMAQAYEATLHCSYVISFSKVLHDLEVFSEIELLNKFKTKHQKGLEEFVAAFGITPKQLHIDVGAPEKLIPSISNKLKADLIVVGSHGKTGLLSHVLGSNSEKILHKIRTDVLAVKEPLTLLGPQ